MAWQLMRLEWKIHASQQLCVARVCAETVEMRLGLHLVEEGEEIVGRLRQPRSGLLAVARARVDFGELHRPKRSGLAFNCSITRSASARRPEAA